MGEVTKNTLYLDFPDAVIKSTPFFLISGFILVVSYLVLMVAMCSQRHSVLFFFSGIFFIIAGKCSIKLPLATFSSQPMHLFAWQMKSRNCLKTIKTARKTLLTSRKSSKNKRLDGEKYERKMNKYARIHEMVARKKPFNRIKFI